MPMHALLTEHPKLIAAQEALTKAQEIAARPNRQYSEAVIAWEREAVDALTAGQEPRPRPEPPDGSVIRELQGRQQVATRLIDRVKADIAVEIEADCRKREAVLLAEVEQLRSRLAEIADEGVALAQSVAHLDRASGRAGLGRHPLAGNLDPAALLKHTATGRGWIPADR